MVLGFLAMRTCRLPTVEWFADSNRLLITSRPVVIYNCAEDSYTWVSQDTPTSPGPPFCFYR